MRKTLYLLFLTAVIGLSLGQAWGVEVNDSAEGDEEFYRLVACKFQVLDKLGRTVQCPTGSTLAFQLLPNDGGLYLNGEPSVEVGDITINANTWREARLGPNGIFEVELPCPAQDESGLVASYAVRFKGASDLNTASLQNSNLALTKRGTAHDIEPLNLDKTVRQKWELPTIFICAFLAIFIGWLKAAKVRARKWEELIKAGDANCDSVADSKRRLLMTMVTIVTAISAVVAIFCPGVTGFFPYCGVALGSATPLVFVFLLTIFA